MVLEGREGTPPGGGERPGEVDVPEDQKVCYYWGPRGQKPESSVVPVQIRCNLPTHIATVHITICFVHHSLSLHPLYCLACSI